MESEINRKIREVLEMFGVDTNKVIGKWNIIGHLKNAATGGQVCGIDNPHAYETKEDHQVCTICGNEYYGYLPE